MADSSSTPQSKSAVPSIFQAVGSIDEAQVDSAVLHVLMETLPDMIYFKDRMSRFVRVNRAQADLLGLADPNQAVGKTDMDFFVGEHAQVSLAEEQEIIRTEQALLGKEENIVLRDGRMEWVSTTKLPWRDGGGRLLGTVGLSRIITAQKVAEQRLLDERNLLRTIIDHLPSRIFVKDLSSRYLINNAAHQRELGVTNQEAALGKRTRDFLPGDRGARALSDDRQVLSGGPSIINQERETHSPGAQSRWVLTTKVPLRDREGRLVGLVGISHDITQQKRTEQELRLRTEQMQADLMMARQVQEAFIASKYPCFPRDAAPEKSRLCFSHRYQPAETLGGDFFDVLQLSDTQAGIIICDVMGHGVQAGLVTALIRGVIAEVRVRPADPAHVLREINQTLIPILQKTGLPVFATVFFAIIDVSIGIINYASAGHPAPFVVRRSIGCVDRLELENPEPAAGLLSDFVYTSHIEKFLPGDALFAYTDGLSEAANNSGQLWGEDALQKSLEKNAALRGRALIDATFAQASEHATGHAFDDDICTIVVESSPET